MNNENSENKLNIQINKGFNELDKKIGINKLNDEQDFKKFINALHGKNINHKNEPKKKNTLIASVLAGNFIGYGASLLAGFILAFAYNYLQINQTGSNNVNANIALRSGYENKILKEITIDSIASEETKYINLKLDGNKLKINNGSEYWIEIVNLALSNGHKCEITKDINKINLLIQINPEKKNKYDSLKSLLGLNQEFIGNVLVEF